MLWESTEKTIAYDLKQNSIAYFPIPNKTWDMEGATFVESLASPPGHCKEGEECPPEGEECLCLVRYVDPEGIGSERDVEVLVMKEYSVGESWTSLFTISCVPLGPAMLKGLVMVPFCFRKNGEVLIALNGEKILVFDPDEESKRYIQIPNIGCNAQVMVYKESMVSPVAYRDEEGSTEGVRRWKTDTDWISIWCEEKRKG
ncbi:hypothetical protein RHSIM_Rhsim04G0209000 [Rhododendron simsii]|uniref:F-box associated domain-containing protein n=1 Tax=Rhododendron simsii TaxID=118357 RepID=A0A834H6X4_RHOSS|nr:hypothetical protein RHSIM_Rhsim04G0209000 [Rhododendron simsii]